MATLYDFGIRGNLGPLRRVQTRAFQTWALERLIFFSCPSGDIRWVITLFALRSFTAVWAFGRRRLLLLARAGRGRFRGRYSRC